jgi:TonB family protein
MSEALKHANEAAHNRVATNRRRLITQRHKNFQFIKGAVFVLIFTCATIFHSKAAPPPPVKYHYPTSAAIDAKGVAYLGTQYKGRPPWIDDVIHTVAPDYPYSARATHHQGTGIYRLILDLKTGTVTRVTIIRSTGFGLLDDSVITAFRQWRWKPGKWKEIGLPVIYELTR